LHNVSSEFLRPNHGEKQVAKQQQGDDADNDVFHGASYSFPQKRTYSALTAKNAAIIPM
jgi:hypothetical protein